MMFLIDTTTVLLNLHHDPFTIHPHLVVGSFLYYNNALSYDGSGRETIE